jgi:hypothetical protein
MSNHIVIDDWIMSEASPGMGSGPDPMAGGPGATAGPPGMPGAGAGGPPPGDTSVANPAPNKMGTQPKDQAGGEPGQKPDITNDPSAPDMPKDMGGEPPDFEQWKNLYFKESIKGDTQKLVDMIHQIRDLDLDAYPRKFVEDNLQVQFLRQHANIDRASKEIRKLLREELDQNNPSVSLVNHIQNVLATAPDLNNIFIKLNGCLGMKGDLHRKFIAAMIGGVQVGAGGNAEDVIYNDKAYSIRLSTRFNARWGMLDIGKWSMREDDPDRYLSEPELKKLEDGSPEEKDVLRRRVVMESIAETFKTRAFLANVVGTDGTVYTLGWDLTNSLRGAYTEGKLIVKTSQGEESEAMIDDNGAIVPFMDIKILYQKETGKTDEDGKPEMEDHEFLVRREGTLYLTASLNVIREAASSFQGIVFKETPYQGNPSDLRVLQRCVPSAPEILMRNC